ncbi:hypothetical protein LSH36_93g02001 [Paralvinella palmiformis]|uniref:NADH dehydrogenase [ubiquinone] 1 beta subcomplex subunit 2, mitochondrial n=1 Tax=Paralvinella palmiformis TaxID=53620 RepID=A0AAD9K0H3_9ANNE|nr:hypothetical protein LSH36_93g02001 [Paralvinella palmiformis]
MFGLSRLAPLGRRLMLSQSGKPILKSTTRSSSGQWFYREENRNHSAYVKYTAEIVMGLAWYWVLYHIWYDTGKLVGEFPYPDPSTWTDRELGIPADDED